MITHSRTGPLSAAPRTFAGLFFVALATLMFEILLTRIFSVTMRYHFAFAAVSLAMFGMTLGALIVYLRPAWFPVERRFAQLAIHALLFALTLVASFLTQASMPFPGASLGCRDLRSRVHLPGRGRAVRVQRHRGVLALTRFPAQVGRLYAADLAGAALGCIAIICAARSDRRANGGGRRRGAGGCWRLPVRPGRGLPGTSTPDGGVDGGAGACRRRPHAPRVARVPRAAECCTSRASSKRGRCTRGGTGTRGCA